jgi:5-methylcytosine-specific restriction endonuclease McrA
LVAEDVQRIAAAKATVADNKGAQWTVAQAISLQIGGNVELKYDLARVLLELEIPTTTISAMTGLSGGELREIFTSDPISLFPCLDCGEFILARDRKHYGRLSREHRSILTAREGDNIVADALCDYCTEARLQTGVEDRRVRSLSQQARTAQLKRMPFEEYRLTQEWQAKRTQALSRAGYRCQTCSRRCGEVRMDVHHNTYERYGDESIYDLVVLCEACHELFHGELPDAA